MFRVDTALLEESGRLLVADGRVHWLLGGSGSGKSTVCRELDATRHVSVVDMDARIYGTYHATFSPARHPVSYRWSRADDGLAWLLDLTWEEFDAFNRASLPEYLDLLCRELKAIDDPGPIVMDGGICNPALLATVLEPSRIVCMRREGSDAEAIWAQPGGRSEMHDAVLRLDPTGEKWERFLEFDGLITSTLARECARSGVRECGWTGSDSVSAVADRVAGMFGL